MSLHRSALTVVVMAALTLVPVGVAAQQAPAGPRPEGRVSIVGVWSLDKDLSDQGGSGEGGARPQGAPPGGGMGGMGGGRGGRGGGMSGGMGGSGGRGGDRDEMRRAGRISQDTRRPSEGLTIVLDQGVVMVTASDGRAVKLTTDGREQERVTGDGMIKAKARWEGEQLVVEEKIQDGPRVTRTYLVSSDGLHMVVVTRLEGGNAPGGQPVAHHLYRRKG